MLQQLLPNKHRRLLTIFGREELQLCLCRVPYCTLAGEFIGSSLMNIIHIILFFSDGLKTNKVRLVFTSGGVVVGVGIRSEERYDLVKIKPMGWEEDH